MEVIAISTNTEKIVSTLKIIASSQSKASVIVQIYSPELILLRNVPVDKRVSFQRYVYGPVAPVTEEIKI